MRLGTGTSFSFLVQAKDLGIPSLSSDPGRVTVTVRRNTNSPYFVGTPYLKTVDRDTSAGGIYVYMFIK